MITFYVPTLNSEKTIKKCLLSIINQTINPKDLFVIDGGSTDNTINLVKTLNVKIIKTKKGLANARNMALKYCNTEYIASVDADCQLNHDWIKLVVKHMKNKKVAGVCGKLIEKNTKHLADKWRAFHLKQDWGDKQIVNPTFLYGSNNIYITEYLKEVGGYNTKYKTNYEDVDISNRLKEKGYTLVYEPEAICYHLRQDTIKSVIKTARKWSFYSYSVPDHFYGLLKRIIIHNPYMSIVFILKELADLKFNIFIITLLSLLYNEYHDIKYFLNF